MDNLEQVNPENLLEKESSFEQVSNNDNKVVAPKSNRPVGRDNQEITDGFTSTNFGKFKDAESLVKAYNLLQAEFTKKSQRLSELEGELKPLTKMERVNNIVNEWTNNYSAITEFKDELKDYLVQNDGDDLEKLAEQKIIKLLAENFVKPKDLVQDKKFLSDYIFNNDEVKNAIVKDYLEKLKSASHVKVATSFNSAIPLTPPSRVRTLSEASQIAKSIIKKR